MKTTESNKEKKLRGKAKKHIELLRQYLKEKNDTKGDYKTN